MDSDDEIEINSTWRGVPATLICINIYDQVNKTAEVALAATCRVIRQYLRLSGSHHVGVCVYGIESTNSSALGINNVEEIFPLKLPTLDDYDKLQKIDIASFNKAQDLILSEVFRYCSRVFASCKKQLSSRNIIMLSRLDVPPLLSDQKPALKRVVEITDSNIDIQLINISESEYDVDLFYKNLLINANKKEDIVLPKPIWDKHDIEKLMYQQSHRHLAVARLNFEIGEGLEIGVGIYSLIKSDSQFIKKTDLHRDTNAILTSVNKTEKVTISEDNEMDVDDEQINKPVPLLKSELLYYKIFGEEKVSFTDDEMKAMKNPFGPPMLKLLGFKPANSMCKEKWFLKPCYFLFPNEGIIEGSFLAFKAFYKACIATKVVAICVMCTRVNARPIIVALSPSSNPLGLNAEIGFDVIRVPFIENLRQLPVEDDGDNKQISDSNKVVMKDILKTLQFDFNSNMFENPKIQKQYRAIEAKAMDDDDDEPFVDTTKRDPHIFQDLQDDLFQELFGPFGLTTGKRTISHAEGGSTSKRTKQYSDIPPIDETLLQERLNEGKVCSYTVTELKSILHSRSIPELPALTGLKKAELVELVYNNLS